MNSLPFLLSSIALATLAGCAESGITLASDPALLAQAQAGAGGTVAAASPAATALRAGYGRVESILVIPAADTRTASKTNKQISMRMNDGTLQYFDTEGRVMVGDRIEITSSGTMRRGL
jgi:hypothetical protein